MIQSWRHRFRKVPFKSVFYAPKPKAGVFKFLRLRFSDELVWKESLTEEIKQRFHIYPA